jgi:uncharacterized delta-60 repeat protein
MQKINRILTLVTLCLVISSPSYAQWAITHSGNQLDSANSVQQTSDGGYVVAGWTGSFGVGVSGAWILKLNSDGTIAWEKIYGGNNADEANSIQQTSDGGYVVAGETYSFGAGAWDAWILKLNSDGTIAWQKTYGGGGTEYASSIQQTSDGGYIVTGMSDSFGTGNLSVWVLKLNSAGTIDWQQNYGGIEADFRNCYIQQTSDGGYVVATGTLSFGAGNLDIWVSKLNSDGTIDWQKTYGGNSQEYANSIQQTSDGGYIVVGDTTSFGAGTYDAWILKLNSDGTIAWQKTYGGNNYDFAKSIQQTTDGGYVVAGWTGSFGVVGVDDAWILKLNSDGTIAWQKTYGGNDHDWARSVQQTSDGGYVVAGDTDSFGAAASGGADFTTDLWVLKLNSDGEISGCSAKSTSNATVSDTSAVISDTNVVPAVSAGVSANTTVTPSDSSAATDYVCLHTIGDVTGNGKVDLQDSVVALQVLVGVPPSTTVNLSGDVNGDSKIGQEELIFILQKISELRE